MSDSRDSRDSFFIHDDNFFTAVGYIAFIAGLFLLGTYIGCTVGRSPKYHHTSYHNEHGEITCEICKELLEKGKTNEHK